ncbi:hypothetical protein ACFQI7_27905 [Paenibacillus allorhizosphaerae]|uniref:DUF2357 domain-containing protein n=1 Tax=Paenibacillus allorhizosphaerae TaxID=2849866 RepID=A0ABN7TQQ0_9BACL|nr:hypothetical protein [Paenibacillus allorhizosphaerae]CAG7651703.1 hypothetical protein PAECIP111802_05030 [Paenibacillus allorhizosphaerae]
MRYNADSLPFEVEFFTGATPSSTQKVAEFWSRGAVSPKSIDHLVSIKEGVQIGARLFAKDGFEKDDKARLVIQSGTYDEEGKQIEINIHITSQGTMEYIFNHERNQIFPWRLGVYFFDVHFGDAIYSSAIFVSPIHLSTSQVQYMHLLLEQEVEGICYDLIYTSKSTGNEHEFLNSKSYYDYVLRLMNEKHNIDAALYALQRNLITQVKTDYQEGPSEKKVDHKSLRWKAVRGESFSLNKKKNLTCDIPANQWIKHVLLFWKQDLAYIEKDIDEDCKQLQLLIRSKEEEKRSNEERKRNWWNDRELSQESRDSMKSIMHRIEDDIKKAERQLNILTRWNQLVKNLIGRFGYLLSSTELSIVTRARSKPQLKDQNYRKLTELYEKSSTLLIGNSKSNHVVPILKPTWKIYEQFVYFQVIDILRKCGFSVRPCCDVESLRDMASGHCIELEDDETILHVWYDKHVYIKEDAVASGDMFFSSRLIQPDIRIDMYKKEQRPVFLSTLAMDAKHRRYKSLHNENFTSNVSSQMLRYAQIFYRGEYTAASRRRPVVSSVLCVYSRDSEAPIKKEELPIVFIQLFPEIDHDQLTGYKELMGEIHEWLKEYVD